MTRTLPAIGLVLMALALGCNAQPDGAMTAVPVPSRATREMVTTEDGLDLDARLFAADSRRVVILLHMYQANQESWFATAAQLQQRGTSALTLDFRGYGASEGEVEPADIERDVRAAVAFAKERGYERIVLAGASMGGTAAIGAAPETAVDGVLALSPPMEFRGLQADTGARAMQRAGIPLATVAAEGDASARHTVEMLRDEGLIQPESWMLMQGRAHGTDLLKGEEQEAAHAMLFEFLERVWS